MQRKIVEYLNALGCGYVILICAVLPLYMRNGFIMIGDAKYTFFLIAALLFFLLSLPGAALLFAMRGKSRRVSWSALDVFAALYAVSVTVSFLGSPYRETALFGYADWHMGLITQLFLVWGYFFVSRCFKKDKFVWKIIWSASGAVFVIGVLNRYQFDPLGTFGEIDRWNWNYENLLSTIGNINWYCSYLCLLLPLSWYVVWRGRGREKAAGCILSLIGNISLFTQGSMGGYLGAGVSLFVLFCVSLKDAERLLGFLEVMILFTGTPLLIYASIPLAPRGVQLVDTAVLDWKGWPLCFIFLLLLYLFQKKGKGLNGPAAVYAAAGGAVLLALFLLLGLLWREGGISSVFCFEDEWGNGRGALWKAAIQCFVKGDWRQKLIGAGPDCYACVVYELTDLQQRLLVSGQWEGAVFANAHNEWLNILVTGGVAGLICYCGIFASAFALFWKNQKRKPLLVLGMMMAAGYCAYGLVSFQQIVTAPAVFVIFGMLEGERQCEGLKRSV